jgi:hypothetical protein
MRFGYEPRLPHQLRNKYIFTAKTSCPFSAGRDYLTPHSKSNRRAEAINIVSFGEGKKKHFGPYANRNISNKQKLVPNEFVN